MGSTVGREAIEASLVDHRMKGIPGGIPPLPLGEIGRQGWNVLREDLPLPLVLLKESALDHNRQWMRRFLAHTNAAIAPHGKTTMSPQLFRRQLDDGAWGITVATVHQLQVCRDYGFPRVLLANQLVGRQAIRYVLDELDRDPEFEFFCLVDSVEGVRLLADAARRHRLRRPIQVLLEGGYTGGRTGCCDLSSAIAVGRAVKDAEPWLSLRGVEGFEGLINGDSAEETQARVLDFLGFLVEIALECELRELLAPGPLILTAGGSAFYDLVVKRFARVGLAREFRVVTRSGCYLTHDSRMYSEQFQYLIERSPEVRELGEGLRPAIEIWAYVQSRPEPDRAILTMGKRDCSFDSGLPIPLLWFRGTEHCDPQPFGVEHRITDLNDQHAHLSIPPGSPLRVGDMVASGISHPCTTFDRWQLLFAVNDRYDVISAIRTFF